jgi:DNA-binding MarR family transcriptional regulator
MCDRLVAKGLVAREPDSGDRRQIRVVLTELGQGTVDDLTERRRIGIGRVLSVIPTAEQMAIAESLGRLAAAGEEQPE